MDYASRPASFDCIGVDLSNADDGTSERKFPVIKNLRRRQHGRIEPRRGLTQSIPYASAPDINSMARLDNGTNFAFFFGDGSRILYGGLNQHATFTPSQISTGWATGVPKTFVATRPYADRSTWLYVSDGVNARKFDVNSTSHSFGITAPTAPPNVVVSPPHYQFFPHIEDGGITNGAWAGRLSGLTKWYEPLGGADSIYVDNTLSTGAARAIITTNTSSVIYDVGGSGWCVVEVTATALYDGDTTTAFTNYPGAIRGVGPGTMLSGSPTPGYTGARYLVDRVYRSTTESQIQKIHYDNEGPIVNSQTASVQLSGSAKYELGQLVYASSGANRTGTVRYGRVTSIHAAEDGKTSALRVVWGYIAVSPPADNWYFAGLESVRFWNPTAIASSYYAHSMFFKSLGEGSLRVYGPGPQDVSDWFYGVMDGLKYTSAFPGAAVTGDGENDYVHLSIMLSDPAVIKELKFTIHCMEPDYDDATGEYYRSRAGYFFTVRGSELAGVVSDDVTAVDTPPTDTDTKTKEQLREEALARWKARRDWLQANGYTGFARSPDDPFDAFDPNPFDWNPPGTEGPGEKPVDNKAGVGGYEWKEVWIRVKDMNVIGEKLSLSKITSIDFTVTTVGEDKPCTMRLGSLWIGGGYGLDVGTPDKGVGLPYYYRYRYRNSATGVVSNYSPPFRGGVYPRRQRVSVTVLGTSEPAVNKIDIQRWGGSVPEWGYVGTLNNPGATTAEFLDTTEDEEVAQNISFSDSNVHYQPFVTVGPAVTIANVTLGGTSIYSSSGGFNTAWAPGTVLRVNTTTGITVTTLYRVVTSKLMEIDNPLPSQNATLTIEQPVLVGQPLPVILGPWQGMILGIGDTNNPGRLYRTRAWSVDSTVPEYWIDITDGSDPLQNGLVWNDRCYVWSTKRMFEVTFNPQAPSQLQFSEIPGSKGLSARYALTSNRNGMFWIGREGFYSSTGSSAILRSKDLERLVRSEGRTAGSDDFTFETFNGSVDWGMINTLDSANRLATYENRVYWVAPTMLGTPTARHIFMYDLNVDSESDVGWWPDQYAAGRCPTNFYGDDRATMTRLYAMMSGQSTGGAGLAYVGGATDLGSPFLWDVQTPWFDGGKPDRDKRWGELNIEVLGNPIGLANVYLLQNYSRGEVSVLGAFTASGLAPTTYPTLHNFVLGTGDGITARAISLRLQHTSHQSELRCELIRWEPYWLDTYPEFTQNRGTDFYDQGLPKRKYVRGLIVEADTLNEAVWLELIKDGNTVAYQLPIQHNGRKIQEYGVTPFDTALLSVRPQSAAGKRYKFFKYIWVLDEYPFLATTVTPWDDAGSLGPKWIEGMELKADTAGAQSGVDVEFQLEDNTTTTITVYCNHAGRLTKRYSWDPVMARQVRLKPAGSYIGIFEVRYIAEPLAALEATHGSQWDDLGLLGPKYIRGLRLKADSAGQTVSISVQRDGGTVAKTIGPTIHENREVEIYEWDEFVAHEVRLVPSARIGILKYEWIFEPVVDTRTEWDNLGRLGAKFVQGVIVEADTGGAARTLYIDSDDLGDAIRTITADHDGRIVQPYSWEPFITHLVRLRPATPEQVTVFKYEFIWEPEPELTTHWESQETTHDMPGWFHLRDGRISVMLSDVETPLTLTITADGTDYSYLVNPALDQGLLQKIPVQFRGLKAKQVRYQLTAPSTSPFRLYRRNSEVRVKAWVSQENYISVQPFGDDSRAVGARI